MGTYHHCRHELTRGFDLPAPVVGRAAPVTGGKTGKRSETGGDPGSPLFVVVLTCAATLIYATYSLVSLARFRASAYDLVIFDQGIRSYSKFLPPISVIKGVHNDFGVEFSLLGDHFSPILATLAPFYWIHDGPETLLVAQAVLLAAAIPFLWRYVFRAVTLSGLPHARRAAHAVSIAYAISWPVVETVAFDFHEAAFVPLLLAVLFERLQARRLAAVVVAALLLLLVKEDMGLLVAGVGLSLLAVRRDRLLGIVFVAAGVAMAYVATQIVVPAAGGRATYYWAYSALGADMGEAVVSVLTDPLGAFALLGTPPVKLLTIALTLAPMLFLPLLSPVTIALVPLLLERMLASSFPNWWVSRYHYAAFIVIIVFVAGVDGFCRIARRRDLVTPFTVMVVVTGVAIVPFSSLGSMFTPGFYTVSDRQKAAAQAVALVPHGVVVEASNNLAPALSARTVTLLWDRTHRGAPWIVADVGRKTFPFTTVDEQRDRVRWLSDNGYRKVFESQGYVVLTSAAPGPAPSG